MMKKLLKKMKKIERKFETAGPVQRKRLMKSAVNTQKRIDFLTGAKDNETEKQE